MCLLKHDLKETNCGHEQCKNFYMLNKQICMFNLTQPQTNTIQNQNPLLQSQAQQKQFITQSFLPFHSAQQTLNTKRFQSPTQTSPDDQEGESSLKKVKTETTANRLNGFKLVAEEQPNKEGEDNHAFLGNVQNKISDINRISQLMNGNNMSNTLLASLLSASTGTSNSSEQSINSFSPYSSGNVVVPIVQNAQNSIQMPNNTQNQQMLSAQQGMFNPFTQLLTQNMMPNMVNGNTVINGGNNFEVKTKPENPSSNEAFLKEFQSRTLGLLATQNKMLMDLKEKNDVVQDTLACLISEINTLKTTVKQSTQERGTVIASNPIVNHQYIANSSETATVENLVTFLYGPEPDFQYQLVLKSDLSLPLYRERNFRFTVLLADKDGNLIENFNRIPLTIGIYSSENPPKFIDSNTAGNKILKGFIEKDLVNGSVTFEKIQIKEVTSHFRNGWVFFVVYPKVTTQPNNNVLHSGNGVNVNINKIRPLVLEKVIVKAKKIKEKDHSNENDDKDEGNQNDSREDTLFN